MSKRLVWNSVSNVAVFILKLIVAFFLTPVIVKALGNHDYGINEIVVSLIGYMGLLEIGLQPAVTRFVASYSTSGDNARLQSVFSSAMFFATCVGALTALVLFGWALLGVNGLTPEGAENTRYVYFLSIVACQVLFSFPGNVILCVHQGHQRYGLVNAVTALNTLIGSSIVYIYLQQGYGLLFLTIANCIGVTIKFFVLGVFLTRCRYGNYRIRISLISKSTMKDLIMFGSKSFILGVASSFSKRASPILIGSMIAPVKVVFYMLPFNLVGYLANLVAAATLSFMPYFSSLHATGDTQRTKRVFATSSRYVVGISVCGFVSAGFLGPAFLAAWVGPQYSEQGLWVIYLAVACAAIKGMNPFHGRLLTGINMHGALARIRSYDAGLFLALSLFSITFFELGIEGVALSVLVASVFAEPMIMRLVCQHIDWSVSGYLKSVVLPLLLPAGALATYYWLLMGFHHVATFIDIFLTASGGLVLYFALFLFLVVSRQEKSEIFAKLKASF